MPRPRHITEKQLAAVRARVLAGETQSAVARSLGMKRATLGYHLRGGKAARLTAKPWFPALKSARRALAVGNHAEAAYHFTAAAKVLINL